MYFLYVNASSLYSPNIITWCFVKTNHGPCIFDFCSGNDEQSVRQNCGCHWDCQIVSENTVDSVVSMEHLAKIGDVIRIPFKRLSSKVTSCLFQKHPGWNITIHLDLVHLWVWNKRLKTAVVLNRCNHCPRSKIFHCESGWKIDMCESCTTDMFVYFFWYPSLVRFVTRLFLWILDNHQCIPCPYSHHLQFFLGSTVVATSQVQFPETCIRWECCSLGGCRICCQFCIRRKPCRRPSTGGSQ